MTSPETALPANFMGASLKGGKLSDLKTYLRAVESKQKELKENINTAGNKPDDNLVGQLAECNKLIDGIQTMINNKQKMAMEELMGDPTNEGCEVAKAGPVARRGRTNDARDINNDDDESEPPSLEDMNLNTEQEKMIELANEAILGAAMRNDPNDIRQLVEGMGVNPSHANKMGQSALHVAALWGNVEAVEKLLLYGANIHAQNLMSGATPLHSIMMSNKGTVSNHLQCLSLLLEHGADPNALDTYGRTPADYWSGEAETRCLVAKLLPEQLPIFVAIDQGDVSKVEQMIRGPTWVKIFGLQSVAGKKLNGKIGMQLTQDVNEDGRHQIKLDGMKQIKLIKPTNLESVMKEEGKQSVLMERCMGKSPLLYTIDLILEERANPTDYNVLSNLVNILKILSEEGQKDDDNNNFDRMMLLVEGDGGKAAASNDTNSTTNNKPSALVRVCEDIQDLYTNGYESELELRVMEHICKLLVPFADVTNDTKLLDMFHTACRKNQVAVANFYLDIVQININAKGRSGMTGLHFAARSGCTNMVQYLLQQSTSASSTAIDVTIQDNMGKTPLDAAKINEKHDVISILEQFEAGKKISQATNE